MILRETAIEATKHPKVMNSLQEALKCIEEEGNQTLVLDNYGGQGLIYKLNSDKYPFPILIKIPFYSRHPSEAIAEHGILKEARIAEVLTKSGEDLSPKLLAFHEEGRYLIREYALGEELAEHLKKCDEPERDQLLLQVFELVKKLFHLFHDYPEQSYTIRDLKPRNMIYTTEGKLYMIDCGSCRPESNMVSRDREKAIKRFGCGKYLHWPIEQLIEDPELCDRRVDYFSWGVLAYYTLFLERPYTNDTADLEIAKAEYDRRYRIACERLEKACALGRLSEQLKENIVWSLHPDARQRRFIV